MSGVRWTVNCSILLTGVPLLQRPAAARAAGFDAVEFWWPFATSVPGDAEVEEFARAVEDGGVTLTGINFAAGSIPDGDRGFLSHPGRAAEFRGAVDVAAGLGRRLGTTVFNALYGNRLDGVPPAQQDAVAAENLAFAAARVPGTVVVEPLSGAPRYPLRTVEQVLAVLDGVGAPNTAVLADLYHLATNGEDVAAAIERHAARFGHVQVADSPGRHEPGTGALPIGEHLAALGSAGYAGFVGLEYLASAPDPFAWLPAAQRGLPVGGRS